MSVIPAPWEERHARLIERIARERDELGQIATQITAPVARVEKITARTAPVFRQLTSLWLPVVVVLFLRPRRALRWAAKAATAYRMFQRVRRVLG